jgi:hypothetical protein
VKATEFASLLREAQRCFGICVGGRTHPERAAFMHSKTLRPQNIAVLLVVAWLLIAANWFAQYGTATASSLFDGDDAMRLVGRGAAELQAGLWRRLQTGKVPDWLALVPLSRGPAFTIYRVTP